MNAKVGIPLTYKQPILGYLGQCPDCRRVFLRHSVGGDVTAFRRCRHYHTDVRNSMNGKDLDSIYTMNYDEQRNI